VDEYLAGLTADKRAALERLRKIIRAAAPRAEEHIAYGMPAFRLAGKWLLYMGASASHCALYGVEASKEDLSGYDTSGRGTLRFPPDEPLPATLVSKLVKKRMARIAGSKR
jgi:uncharacterized protein YdhG (YjbR/CyaY superfamily)